MVVEGIWTWLDDPKGRRSVLKEISSNKSMVKLLVALSSTNVKLSPYEAEEMMGLPHWASFWAIRQLQSLGLIKYEINVFGDFGYYSITDRGKEALELLKP